METVLTIAIAVGLSFLVLVPSSIVTNVLARLMRGRSEAFLALSMQATIAVLTLVLALLIAKDLAIIGTLSFPILDLAKAVALAVLIIAILYVLGTRFSEGCSPPIHLENALEFAALAFLAAPIGEEILFRGLVEGYLLVNNTGIAISMIVPAVLFSLMHVVPYKDSPKVCLLFILTSSFVMGLVAGYFRAVTGSIALPIIIHSIGNTPGLRYFTEKHRDAGTAQ